MSNLTYPTLPDGTAQLTCKVRVASTGKRCTSPARAGTRRCGVHTSVPPARQRCRYVWDDGVRCEGRVKSAQRGDETCVAHQQPCPGWDASPCGRKRARIEPELCRACSTFARRCLLEVDDGRMCPAAVEEPDDRCGNHLEERWPDADHRCLHVYASGFRCHRTRNATAEVCIPHTRECPGCGLHTGRADGLCARCSPRCTTPRCRNYPRPDALICHIHDAAFCSEIAAHTGLPCAGPVAKGGRCRRHLAIPSDDQRCVITYDQFDGQRCPNERMPGNGDHVCYRHRTSWDLIGRDPRQTLFGSGGCEVRRGPGAGELCRNPVLKGGRCIVHQMMVVPEKRCVHRYATGERCPAQHLAATGRGTGVVCTDHVVVCRECGTNTADTVRALCRDHRPSCLARSAKTGLRCRISAAANAAYCGSHRDLVGREDRCWFIYDDGSPCLAARVGDTGSRCINHRVQCCSCGKLTSQGDGWCRADRPHCASTTAKGQPCTQPAYELTDGLCLNHFRADRHGRCALITSWGEPCARPATILTSDGLVCRKHANALAGTAIEGRCTHVYPTGQRCPASRAPLGPGVVGSREALGRSLHRFCTNHWNTSSADRCSSPTVEGGICNAYVMLDADGHPLDVCAHHLQVPDDERCDLVFETGVRCPAQRWDGRRYCAAHRDHQPACIETSRSKQQRCTFTTVADLDYCGIHAPPPNPADQCQAAAGCSFHRERPWLMCRTHADQQPTCRANRLSGGSCEYRALDTTGLCGFHQVPEDPAQRCSYADGEQPCSTRRMDGRMFCRDHGHLQLRCEAVRFGVPCHRYATDHHTTCDHHEGWDPTMPDDKPEDLERFFLRPRADRLWRMAERRTQAALWKAEGVVTGNGHTPAAKSGASPALGGTGDKMTEGLPTQLQELEASDPYDLTGARRRYREMVANGKRPEVALRSAKLLVGDVSPETIRTYGSKLNQWFEWCQDNLCRPVPADPDDVLDFLGWLAERGLKRRDGKYQASTFQSFRHALSGLHKALKHPDPFDDHDLVRAVNGYGKTYGRVERQAHAVRAPELTRLVQDALGERTLSALDLRDTAIIALVADPQVGISYREAAELTWKDVLRWPSEGTDEPLTLLLSRGKKLEREVEVPNRIALVEDDDHREAGEVPMLARLCAVASLRAVHASHRGRRGDVTPTGPIFRKDDDSGVTHAAVKKVIVEGCKRAGIEFSKELTVDDRGLALLALDEPEFFALRDATILLVSWWASLRRSEVSALSVGDIGADARARGLFLSVRKSKTDQIGQGQLVAVPHAVLPNGRKHPLDLQTSLHSYLSSYARHLGRPLEDTDPLFISTRGEKSGERLSDDSVGAVIARYVEDAGLEAEIGEYLSHHGLRAGWATEALSGGMPSEAVARRQRRASTESLAGYFRLADPFEDSVSYVLDLDAIGADLLTVEDVLFNLND